MIRKKLTAIMERMEDGLRSLFDQITPDGKITVILIMLFVFSLGSIYMTVSSIYNMGKKSGRQIRIEHINRLELEQQHKTDSITYKKDFNDEQQ